MDEAKLAIIALIAFLLMIVCIVLFILSKQQQARARARAHARKRRAHKPATESLPALKGPEYYEREVVGESRYQQSLLAICGRKTRDGVEKYVSALLVLEDTNPHDNQAVRVEIHGMTVGISRGQELSHFRGRAEGGRQGWMPVGGLTCGGWDYAGERIQTRGLPDG